MNARRQRVVVDYDADNGWMLMHDDGAVEFFGTASGALKAIQREAHRGNDTVTLTVIEWRNAPDGFTPPTGKG